MKKYQIPDRNGRLVTFAGELVAQSSSDDGRAQRWSENELFRTQDGRYVLHTIGRSSVYHAPGASCTKQAKPTLVGDLRHEKLQDLIPCRTCTPENAWDAPPSFKILVEQDRHAVTVSEKPAGLVKSLYMTDDDGVEYLTKLSQHLLENAARVDAGIRDAWQVRAI